MRVALQHTDFSTLVLTKKRRRRGGPTTGGRPKSSETWSHNMDPDPVTVLHTARQRGPADSSDAPVGRRRYHQFAVYLADLYTQTVAPRLVRQYAHEVLEDAFRRAVGSDGRRLTELAEKCAPETNSPAPYRRCAPTWLSYGATPKPRGRRSRIRSHSPILPPAHAQSGRRGPGRVNPYLERWGRRLPIKWVVTCVFAEYLAGPGASVT